MTLYKYCKRCGKRLKGEENRQRGYGETCFKRVQADAKKDLNLLIPPSNYPIEIDVEQDEKSENLQGRGARAKHEESSEKSQSKAKSSAKQIIRARQDQEPRQDRASKGKSKQEPKHEDKAKSKQGTKP